MRILLTGADGFTGMHFALRARDRGHDIIAFRADLTCEDAVRLEVDSLEFDAVVHLAGISFVGHDNEAAFYDVNVVGTTKLLNALCAKGWAGRVLVASSANVYGNTHASSPICETNHPLPINHYANSKLAMEYMAKTFSNKLSIVMVRPFNYTGPGQDPKFVVPKLVDHFVRKLPSVNLGNVDVEREFNDVRMVCDVYLALLAFGKPDEVYNICTGKAYSLREIIDALGLLTGHSLDITVNQALVRVKEVRRLCGDPTKLKAALSGTPSEIVAPTLIETLEWMLAEQHHSFKRIKI